MQQLKGTLELSNGTRLEYVAVNLAEKRDPAARSGWGGVFKSTDVIPIDLLRKRRLVLENASSGAINVVHISPTAERSMAIFHGVEANTEDTDNWPLDAA